MYCSPSHRQRAKMRRYRQRRAGNDVSPPTLPNRREVASELAHRLAATRPAAMETAQQELTQAQAETARLKSELARRSTSLSAAQKSLRKEREKRASIEREIQFVALAFARTAKAAGIAEKIAPTIYSRVAEWLPEGENPWV